MLNRTLGKKNVEIAKWTGNGPKASRITRALRAVKLPVNVFKANNPIS